MDRIRTAGAVVAVAAPLADLAGVEPADCVAAELADRVVSVVDSHWWRSAPSLAGMVGVMLLGIGDAR